MLFQRGKRSLSARGNEQGSFGIARREGNPSKGDWSLVTQVVERLVTDRAINHRRVFLLESLITARRISYCRLVHARHLKQGRSLSFSSEYLDSNRTKALECAGRATEHASSRHAIPVSAPWVLFRTRFSVLLVVARVAFQNCEIN
ncbi:hypothetical protein Ae201684P_016183 [Aphanomyces euteiches]|nr:hypothetical protein Ae201684P_016183 [Aphanomyces euteiches]